MRGNRPITQPGQLQLIAVSMLIANVVYVVLCFFLESRGGLPAQQGALSPDQAQLMIYGLVLAGLGTAGLSFLVRRLLAGRLDDSATLQQRAPSVLVPMALAEAAGAFGFVLFLLTGSWPFAALLWGISMASGILHFPRRASLQPQDL